MKALVKKEVGVGLSLEDCPIPEYGIKDVLIKVHKTSICGTDLHIYNWDSWAKKTIITPLIIGHEFSGIIEATGSEVSELKSGDVVSGEGHLVCNTCRNCLAGRRHLCSHAYGLGIHRSGAFAQYLVLPESNVWRVDPDIPMDIIASFDPLGNAVHTALSFDLVGEDVLITGAGPIGMMAAAIAKHVGAHHIIISDINPYRLQLAKQMGVTSAIDVSKQSICDIRKHLAIEEGFKINLEMSGSPQALDNILANSMHGGNIALLGLFPEKSMIDWDIVIFKGLTIKGIYGREMFETWYKMTAMLKSGLDIAAIITHELHYTEFNEAFELIRSGRCGKVILDWTN